MVFSSLIFVFFFLPAVLFLYYIAQNKYRNYILLCASLLFYAYGEHRFVFVLLISIFINCGIAILINKYREAGSNMAAVLMWADVCLNIGLLFIYKYLGFSIKIINRVFRTDIAHIDIIMPIGISFFTFQALSYVIDVYKGRVNVQTNPLYVALYISFFPQLIAGPIVRYSTIEKQIEDRQCSLSDISYGIKRFMLGFCKKVIIANNLSNATSSMFNDGFKSASVYMLWFQAIAFSLQIFFDFSGYSDMAIGLGRMFGFSFDENFNYPYISGSLTEFWRRWHISLSRWFRDYVYIPLGGSKNGGVVQVRNMLIVWLLTGLWHGADYTFIAWGLIYFFMLAVEKYVVRPDIRNNAVFKMAWRLVTLLTVNFCWVIFNSPGLKTGLSYCLSMLGFYDTGFSFDSSFYRLIREYGFDFVIGLLFSTPLLKYLDSKIKQSVFSAVWIIAEPVIYGIVFLWAVSFLIIGAHNPFIYFNF